MKIRKALKKIAFSGWMLAMCMFICVGYAAFSSSLHVIGSVSASAPAYPDVYISEVTPGSSAGVTVNSTSGTVLFASVNVSGTATFRVTVKNISEKVYIFDRVIDGTEVELEGVYSGTDITYSLSGISRLEEVSPNNGTLSFDVTITVPRGVTTDCYVLWFNFIEKTGTEILPRQ